MKLITTIFVDRKNKEKPLLYKYEGNFAVIKDIANFEFNVKIGDKGFIRFKKNSKDDFAYFVTEDGKWLHTSNYDYTIDIYDKRDISYKTGDLIEVSHMPLDSYKRCIFMCVDPLNPDNVMCISDSEKIPNNTPIHITSWRYHRKITKPVWKPKELKLNNTHTAVVGEDKVKVGCHEFTFETILDLANIVKESIDFKKDNA